MVIEMKVKVKDIRSEGLQVQEKLASDLFELAESDIVHLLGPIEVKAKIEKTGNTVIAAADLNGVYAAPCARCLEPVKKKWDEKIVFDFPIKTDTEVIDLGEEIRQEVILNLPPKLLCKEDCQGICLGCGADLNKEKCKCKGES